MDAGTEEQDDRQNSQCSNEHPVVVEQLTTCKQPDAGYKPFDKMAAADDIQSEDFIPDIYGPGIFPLPPVEQSAYPEDSFPGFPILQRPDQSGVEEYQGEEESEESDEDWMFSE